MEQMCYDYVKYNGLLHNERSENGDIRLKVTYRDIAREAGVSVGTVHRYLAKNDYISEDARQKVNQAIKKLGFNPNLAQRFQRRRKTHQLGLLTSFSKDIFNSRYHTHLLGGIMNAVYETDYNLKIIFLKERDYTNVTDILTEYSVDGLLILTWRIHPNLIRLIEMCPKHIPVMLFNDYDPKIEANFVYSDVSQGIEMAVDYLVKKGRKKIAFLKGPSLIHFGSGREAVHVSSIDAYDKLEGFQKGMRAAKLPIKEEWVKECGSYSMVEGYKKTKEVLESKERPDGIVCANDEIALGALNALREFKISCPDEMSVIGFDGIEKGELTTPPLTTVEQLLNSMGFEGGRKLIDILQGKLVDPIHTKFVPKLVIRKSA
ncbi:MAG: hypothetical protein COV74_00220 [Candidatus Omnitrophica bacterium CG11_big_fil_rev_8_21_14_0_20_45_26]|uniref:HTH lacI-type domain-containing protein n=1 Tax=Candidatus Abzuiibacterium crystallinum TaxID=1974748 RepID=A0A2H0LT44_9BACT|nr:MAG: hypothetical protein COV74_00220 [Candidatus Omnitrophica bacterium CG11_big_fil_rev_8_21_14_0_20_45_26]PIW64636.1 MAG: hypothetical protein COW12_05555 [Candidatus Omnitrophica bacterium CG12_big_fil_rev_8_21_14_0_65_45_16]